MHCKVQDPQAASGSDALRTMRKSFPGWQDLIVGKIHATFQVGWHEYVMGEVYVALTEEG